MDIKQFIKENYKHFNAAVLVDAAEAWIRHIKKGGKMFLAMAGALSTGEVGISLGEIIRNDKIHGICCTGANLEEDVFNLIAHNSYKRISQYRHLTPQEELKLKNEHLNRVTDTCIPEEAIRRLEEKLYPFWKKAEEKGERYFPYEFIYQLIRSGELEECYQVDPEHSWVVAACKKNLPIFTPGWEDSALGNEVVAETRAGRFKHFKFVKDGLEQMDYLIGWYMENTIDASMGFFQIGGGIAGDFPICVVPLIRQDLKKECKLWGYFCQISDSTTSYGSYSGAVPNEKITWEKLGIDTPRFVIESDASIVAPLIFQYVLSL
ncbi:MAG: deoxyhypusine synthase family protein [Candidatus Omnitrophica bacterium]|nr:deoxyhypusine synthase family protein [Candidatus Omnitrophota bacterium]